MIPSPEKILDWAHLIIPKDKSDWLRAMQSELAGPQPQGSALYHAHLRRGLPVYAVLLRHFQYRKFWPRTKRHRRRSAYYEALPFLYVRSGLIDTIFKRLENFRRRGLIHRDINDLILKNSDASSQLAFPRIFNGSRPRSINFNDRPVLRQYLSEPALYA